MAVTGYVLCARMPIPNRPSHGQSGGAFLVIAASALGAWWIQTTAAQSVDEILRGDATHATYAAQQLAELKFFTSAELNRIVEAYVSETDKERKAMLKSRYREITGEDIDLRARILQD